MKILKKNNLYDLLSKTQSKYKLITPQEKLWADILFEESGPIEDLPTGYVLPYNSLKDFFFPQSEVLYALKKNKKEKKILFFGVRPCDIKALNFQDFFFGRNPQDYYYIGKRKNSFIISLACNTPAKSCFCIFTKTGPYLESQDNFDLQFTDIDTEYLVEVGNKKGEDFISDNKEFFQESNATQIQMKNACHEHCKIKMGAAYAVEKVNKKLTEEDHELLWKELGLRCTNCGGCEFICPTCFCFNIQDFTFNGIGKYKTSPYTAGDGSEGVQASLPRGDSERSERQRGGAPMDKKIPSRKSFRALSKEFSCNKDVIRMRSWDSCTYEGYSRLSGGFNPYQKREQRIQKRFYCKLYHAKMWFNMYACVGCGRCTSVCPVNLEMESFIGSLIRGNRYESLLKEL